MRAPPLSYVVHFVYGPCLGLLFILGHLELLFWNGCDCNPCNVVAVASVHVSFLLLSYDMLYSSFEDYSFEDDGSTFVGARLVI